MARLRAVHMVDALWCDVHGVYVRGWVHANEAPITSLKLASGDRHIDIVEFHDRPDVQAFYPRLPTMRCGFEGYLACPPFRPVTLEVRSGRRAATFDLKPLPPTHPLNLLPEADHDGADLRDRFVRLMKERRGTVVEVGARTVSPGAELQARNYQPECTFIGVDIHAAPGVDVVCDAHFLSRHIAPESVDGVCSFAVMEHLAAPWLFAAEVNRVLKVGGIAFHGVPQAWPVHEMPNDFWRISSEGLRLLFGPALGFEVLELRMVMPLQLLPHPKFRTGAFLQMPLHPAMGGSEIVSRKVRSIGKDDVAWPLSEMESTAIGKNYPAHGAG